MGGDWRKDRDNFRAMREEIKQFQRFQISGGVSMLKQPWLARVGRN